jgi:hypothetical protein
MTASKPIASLSPSLLARKGTARPAMRPQGFGGFTKTADHDDLGWNDMGEPEPMPIPGAAAPVGVKPPVPPVLVQRAALHDKVTAPADPEPEPKPARDPAPVADAPARPLRNVSVATATRIRRETNAKHVARPRSAFTLRLDTDRHLKLRLASALQNRSAQLLVTEALDAFLETQPEVDALVSQLPGRAKA